MLGEKKLKELSKYVFSISKADQTEVILGSDESTSMRFANSYIHQPTSRRGNWARLRLVFSKKIGVAAIDELEKSALEGLVDKVTQICRFQQDDPGFKSLPTPKKLARVDLFDEATAAASEKELAERVKTVIDKARENHLVASGNLERSSGEMAVASSLGVWACQPATSCHMSTVIMGQAGSGFASDMGWKLSQIQEGEVANRAAQKALLAQNPIDLEPGEYEVVLEPTSFEELLDFFAWLGPNARVYHEQVSYFKNRMGKKVFSPLLTITDDPSDKRGLPASFDFEGQPKEPLVIVRNGVIKNIVYDAYYANKYHKKNSGHALPAPNTFGPIPGHLVIKPGSSSLEEMTSHVKRGLLVTRFWYIRVVHYGEMLLTGMTRDGLFLIENGRITKPVKNMRFTESIPNMFKNILEVGKELTPHPSWAGYAHLVPPMRIANFRFTGKTEF
jgi:predicted Zn-dependent protease